MERHKRLRRSGDVRQVFDEGKSWAHPLVVMIARPNGLTLTRYGFTASRAVGKAVSRNRAKRLMREAARLLASQVKPGWDIMLVARARILDAREHEVRGALCELFQRARLWVEPASLDPSEGNRR